MSKFIKEKNSVPAEHLINEAIRAVSMLLIGNQGENYGVVTRSKALELAVQAGLDLVQVGEKDGQAVVKIMDYGKFLYEKKKQMNEAKKHQKVIQIKEIKIRPNIGDQDYNTKLNQAALFFDEGKRVKFTLQFKGREASMMEDLGPRLFARIHTGLQERSVGLLVEEKESRGPSVWSKIYYAREK